MIESTYWDKSEFNFFETLEDDDKLLYLYDLMIGDFSHQIKLNNCLFIHDYLYLHSSKTTIINVF